MAQFNRLLIVFLLGFSSGLPLVLLTSTLQAWFSTTGMPLFATGMLSLLGLPYLYAVLIGPILDRYTLFAMGKRRSWIFAMQLLLCLGFNALSWFSPSNQWITVIAFMLACFSATQDVAINAHRTEYLPQEEHGLGASLAITGYRLALLVGGGLALILAQYVGWAVTYRIMGCLLFCGMFATYLSTEPSLPEMEQRTFTASFIDPVKALCLRPGVVWLLLFIFFYKLGEAFTTTTSGIVMPFLIQGVGFSLNAIASIYNVIGIFALILGGLVAGLLLLHWSLSRALLLFGLIQALTNLLFVALAMLGANLPLFVAAAISDNFAAGMGSTALVALIMRWVDRRFTATQFTILVAISSLPRVFSGPIAALLQSCFGWVGLYELSFVLALGFIPFLYLIRKQI